MAEEQPQGNIKMEFNSASIGLNMDQTLNQIKPGTLTYALNASLENFDSSSVNYQNEQGNEFCLSLPKNYVLIGEHFINEKNKHIFFITNPIDGSSEIGYIDNNDCIYHTLVNSTCLNFNIDHPIHKAVHKIANCKTEIYWTDGFNPRRYLDIENIPYTLAPGSDLCDPIYTNILDCNQIKIQPNFNIPDLNVVDVTTGGALLAGTYQFAAQYADASGNPYTSYYSITNPTPIADISITTVNYNYNVGKSIVINVSNLDTTGEYTYFNIAVIKTINAVSSVELVGTYFIDNSTRQITYTGQDVTAIRLSINDIFEKFPYYDIAEDLTTAQDVLIWDGLISIDRINYQDIATNITLLWETYMLPPNENYSDELNATNLRGYLRDEVYAFEIAFLLKNGKQTDGFHIPGRQSVSSDLVSVPNTNQDFIVEGTSALYWEIYNTASVIGASPVDPTTNIGNATAFNYGNFAYWESEETYPCNQNVWGILAGQKIRHHKFPDVFISPITKPVIAYSNISGMVMQNDNVFPIGVKIDIDQVNFLIQSSSLTDEQKAEIVGFKILRGDRATNKSIVAKGILRNVNSYTREDQTFYFPNYPYNDLNADPFLNQNNNAWTLETKAWLVTCNTVDPILGYAEITYTDPNSNKQAPKTLTLNQTIEFCSVTRPTTKSGVCTIGPGDYDMYDIGNNCALGNHAYWNDPFTNDDALSVAYGPWINGYCGADPGHAKATVNIGFPPDLPVRHATCWGGPIPFPAESCVHAYLIPIQPVTNGQIIPNASRRSSLSCKEVTPLPAITGDYSKYRQIFNSPETSFGQPFLGDTLKLENVMFGAGKAHFVQVKSNAKYRLLTAEAQKDALKSSNELGSITTNPFNATAMFTAYQAYLQIYINGITRKNYAYSYNSIANYDYDVSVPNNLGIKQRNISIAKYLIPGIQAVGDQTIPVNNYERESSVYIKTKDINNSGLPLTPLPFPKDSINVAAIGITDKSRITIGDSGACATPAKLQQIQVLSYYASLKNTFVNQWGQIYSYVTIDTGFQKNTKTTGSSTIFGGDTFISRFAFKTKLPFFIDNRVNAPDDSDVFYDEIGNVAYPKYWHSARSVLENYKLENTGGTLPILTNIISYKAHKFDCPNDPLPLEGAGRTFYDGYFYLFAYGIPNFYCESSYNTDLRQAFNNKEGDFWPHVSTGIPDNWLQEDFVSIANDNTYTYNVTFSKQNKENTFTHLPPDWDGQACYTHYPFRAIYSDTQNTDADNRVNSWLTYRAISYFDFPQNYGNLISLDGIQNRAILARFENKTLMYNNLLTIDTSNPQAAYVGNPTLFKGAPPIDFAETDLGYVGSQNKMLLKIPNGQITIDAKRGQVFLIAGTQAQDLSAFGSGMNRFFTDHLAFEILRYYPSVDTDNHFNGVGLHAMYDSKFDRVIITKLDYIPLTNNIKYDSSTREFYIDNIINDVVVRTIVELKDSAYFCNKSWTLSFNMNTKTWISFHSYIPNWYIAENNFFYSGVNGCCDDFDFIAGPLVPTPPTTTTTTTAYIDCTIIGGAHVVDCTIIGEATSFNCELEGNGIIICTRPQGLTDYQFITGYDTIPATTFINSTGSQIDACDAINYIYNNPYLISFINVDAGSPLTINQVVYDHNDTMDCATIPNGWYFTQESSTSGLVYNVINGIITEIGNCNPTTTTTTTIACFSYTVTKTTVGIVAVTYNDCSGTPQTVNIGNSGGGPSTQTFCARSGSVVTPPEVTLINNGPC